MLCFFATDLHGSVERYDKLFETIAEQRPSLVFLGGDLLPTGMFALASANGRQDGFIPDYLGPELLSLRSEMGAAYPRILLILGNDDARSAEPAIVAGAELGLFDYIHNRRVEVAGCRVFGYTYVPPTPFLLKDWERYDVSRFVDPGCVSPEEGVRTAPVTTHDMRFTTIAHDLTLLAGDEDAGSSIFLFHTPPHRTKLDRAALDGKTIDHAPVDVHVGSVAVRRFIESRHPLLTLHGHVHESARLTGSWRDRIGRTEMFSAAHDGRELALVRFDPAKLETADRLLL